MAVNRRATARLEPEPGVEASRLHILLVHIDRKVRVTAERARHEHTAHSATMIDRVDEQGLQMPPLQQHEPNCPIGLIYGEIQGHARQKRSHLRLDVAPVPGRKELMGGVHSASPDFHDPRAIGRS